MGVSIGVAVFVLFAAAAVFAFISGGRERKTWEQRPAVLRGLAQRRGFQFVEKPGSPSDLAPIRPIERKGNLTKMELPAAIRGRSLDSQFTLFDVFTETVSRAASRTTHTKSYETYITFRSGDHRYPHFEFVAVSKSTEDSLEGKLLAMAASLADGMMSERNLHRVPIPGRPGFQLFVEDAAVGPKLADALVKMFEPRPGWWVGTIGDSVTISQKLGRSPSMSSLIPEAELDRFIDEATQIERDLRRHFAL